MRFNFINQEHESLSRKYSKRMAEYKVLEEKLEFDLALLKSYRKNDVRYRDKIKSEFDEKIKKGINVKFVGIEDELELQGNL